MQAQHCAEPTPILQYCCNVLEMKRESQGDTEIVRPTRVYLVFV